MTQNINNTIAIVTLSVGEDRKELHSSTYESIKKYCEIQKYDYINFNTNLSTYKDCDRNLIKTHPARFSKIVAVQDTLDSNQYEWVVWFDDDIIITNPKISLETFINAVDEDKNFLISNPYGGNWLNTGIFFAKNTLWTKQLLNNIHETAKKRNYICPYSYGQAHDENILNFLYNENKNNEKDKIHMIAPYSLQSMPNALGLNLPNNKRSWQPNDFSIHVWAGSFINSSFTTRIDYINQLLKDNPEIKFW